MTENQDKGITEKLDLLVCRLQGIQASHSLNYQSDLMLRNRLLNSVRDVANCRFDYRKPANTVQGVISGLYTSLCTTMNLLPTSPVHATAHVTDRRYF